LIGSFAFFEVGVEIGADVWAWAIGRKKQAATSVAARFLYMVVLYMAPEIEHNKARRGGGLRE
jgi:hypothetical protein